MRLRDASWAGSSRQCCARCWRARGTTRRQLRQPVPLRPPRPRDASAGAYVDAVIEDYDAASGCYVLVAADARRAAAFHSFTLEEEPGGELTLKVTSATPAPLPAGFSSSIDEDGARPAVAGPKQTHSPSSASGARSAVGPGGTAEGAGSAAVPRPGAARGVPCNPQAGF
jgi:hypothetical protein